MTADEKRLKRADEFRARYYAVQGLPVPPRRASKITQEERNARKRTQQREYRAAQAANRPANEKPAKAANVTVKHPKGQMLGEPVITSKTKVTIATHQPDPRYHVAPTHQGEFSREWQERRA